MNNDLRHLAQQLNNQNPYTNPYVTNYYENISPQDRNRLLQEFGDYFNYYGIAPVSGGLHLDYETNPQTLGDMASTIASLKLAERNGQLEQEAYQNLINQGYNNPNLWFNYRGMRQ